MTREYTTIPPELEGARLDAALAALRPERGRADWKRRIAAGQVQVDDAPDDKPDRILRAGQVVSHPSSSEDNDDSSTAVREEVAPENIPLTVVYEDDHMLVVNKPAGMAAHPGTGIDHGTLQNALLYHCPASALLPRGGLVHRLDKDTTGLLAAAKTERARRRLTAGFKTRTIGREYLALVCGAPPQTGRVDAPLAASRGAFQKMAVRVAGRPSATRFAVERRWPGFALLRCWLESGRTHQIRVHLEHIGFPVAGDRLYRRRARRLPRDIGRQCLHATELKLSHPETGAAMHWHAPLPEDFQSVLTALDGRAADLEKAAQIARGLRPPDEWF